MVWRTVVIGNPAKLCCRDRQMVVNTENGESSVPLEDLAALVIENQQVSLTAPLLEGIAVASAVIVACDSKHTPCGIFLPFVQHSRVTEVIHTQLSMSGPFQKRCWQRVVRQKIRNQSLTLNKCNREGANSLEALIRKTNSGDTSNMEAQAARLYWPFLFGEPFRRRADVEVNAAMNYGYAILRAAIARGIVARGLIPTLGIHHNNKLNAFNLADDLIEPFRPVVDHLVVELFGEKEASFDREVRLRLVDVVNSQMLINGEQQVILRVVEVVASSLIDAIRAKDPDLLLLPKVIL